MWRATVVLPVPGLPVNTRCGDTVGLESPKVARWPAICCWTASWRIIVLTGRRPTNMFNSSITVARPTWRALSTFATASCWSRNNFDKPEIIRWWVDTSPSITACSDSPTKPRAGMMWSMVARISVLSPKATHRTFILPICGIVVYRATTLATSAGCTAAEVRHETASMSNIGERESRRRIDTFNMVGTSFWPSRVACGTKCIGAWRRNEFIFATLPNLAKWLTIVVSRVNWVSLGRYLGDALYIF